MMIRKILGLTLLAVFLTACAPAAPASAVTSLPATATVLSTTSTPAGISLTDGLGRLVKLSGPAQRVVSMAPSNTEILFAIGVGGQVVGRDEFSDFPAEAKSLPSI